MRIGGRSFERCTHSPLRATLLIEKGIATRKELESLVDGEFPLSGPLGPGRLPFAPQSFAIGETVRVKNEFVSGHVRAPAYIRGRTGTIVHVSTPTPFPDAAGHNMQAEIESTYDAASAHAIFGLMLLTRR